MKGTQIKYLSVDDIYKLTLELFEKIMIAYSLPEAKNEFAYFFTNVVKKSYSNHTFEQFETAFEYNSIGSLNNDKVRFTIQDLTNVINAYSKLKKINCEETKETFEKTPEQIKQIHLDWCKMLNGMFEKYRETREQVPITLPMFTCEYLAKINLLDKNNIDYSEKKIKFKFGQNNKLKRTQSNNEILIYNCFDDLIYEGKELIDYLI